MLLRKHHILKALQQTPYVTNPNIVYLFIAHLKIILISTFKKSDYYRNVMMQL